MATLYLLWGATYAGLFVVLAPQPSYDVQEGTFRAAAWFTCGYCMLTFLPEGLRLLVAS